MPGWLLGVSRPTGTMLHPTLEKFEQPSAEIERGLELSSLLANTVNIRLGIMPH